MNLGTALRQTTIQQYGSFIFYQPLALFVPPPMAVAHLQLNLLYQFWLHTEFIGKLGPLEWFLNTASHHRVHHGRNPYAIDKNYAGVFIIWDKLFGTFEEERDDEKVVYGLIHNINSFEAFYVQLNPWKDFFKKIRMVWRSKRFHGWARFRNMLKAIFYGPGWFPSKPNYRLGDPKDLPKVEEKVVRYGTPMAKWLSVYCILHYLAIQALFVKATETVKNKTLTDVRTGGVALACMVSFGSWGLLFDHHKFSKHIEILRCLCFVFFLVPTFSDAFEVQETIKFRSQAFFIASFVVLAFNLCCEKLGFFSGTRLKQE